MLLHRFFTLSTGSSPFTFSLAGRHSSPSRKRKTNQSSSPIILRHVVLPADVAKLLPKNRLPSEVSCPYMYRHNAMISEVLTTLKEPNGSNSGAIAKHIEVKCKLMKKANDSEVTD
ncbi:hypothetical protein BUALT_Bualt17G0036800 [Buddleja alternifolia]|uniref:Uncharacterized protein n=1 Tax=Buddleja alternifolia TaxID=168488 RepID=A0AAV6WDL0_9LAMI|nr:hypothetical protein BUALT_Bualt17G0036800 [Buddleja alternifolia]